MAGTPLFVITDAGLAAASVATPTGPYIHITSFEVGSGYGYSPLPSDTGLNGSVEFTGVPTAYQSIGNNTLNIICEIPPDAGPFNFGEVALYLDGGVMFAKAVFDTPQTKFSALGSNVVSSYTFNCLLKLQQSVAVFQIDTNNGPPAVFDIFQWSDVFPAGISANPDIPLYLVRELDPAGDSTLLQNTSDTNWTVGTTYKPVYNAATVADSSTTWVEFLATSLKPAMLTAPNREWLLETPDGFFRSVSSIVVSGANYRLNLNCSNDGTYNNVPLLNAPPVASKCRLYAYDISGDKIYWSQIIDPVTATAGQGTYSPSTGVIAAQGLLHSPGNNTGRLLTSADNLNSLTLLSGMYSTALGSSGQPANMPVALDGHIWIHNYGGGNAITQYYYPNGAGGGAAGTGANGAGIYWREYAGGVWYPWYQVSVNGKQGGSGTFTQTTHTTPGTFTQVQPQRGFVHVYVGDGNPTTISSLSVNGNQVSQNTKSGGSGYGRRHNDSAMFFAGDTITYTYSGGGGGNATLSFWYF
jgi:hypothetical protein